jgi:hypothetical protein
MKLTPKRTRWSIGFIDAEMLKKPLHRRRYVWRATLYWHKPNMSRASAINEATKRGCRFSEGGKLAWYPLWPRNGQDGKPRRMGAGTVHETMKFD